MKLSVLIPARNEGSNIGPTLDGLRHRLEAEPIPYEIVVVNDGSRDDTVAEVESRCSKDLRIRLIHNQGRHGFGRALCRGLEAFTGDAVVIVMADGSDDPEDVVAYYSILKNQADCAFGSRWIRGGRVLEYPFLKRILNRFGNNLIRIMFGLRYNDVTNAFKGYRREVIEGCQPLLSAHFNFTVELPLKAVVRGYSYSVIPISWYNRKRGASQFKIEEMGSRYLFILANVWLERLLTRDDYRRPERGNSGNPCDETSGQERLDNTDSTSNRMRSTHIASAGARKD